MLSRIQKTRIPFRSLSTTRLLTSPFPTLPLKEEESKQGKANEILEAMLYGSKKTREEENQTHSKVLARGKYVHELQSKFINLFIHTKPYPLPKKKSIMLNRIKSMNILS